MLKDNTYVQGGGSAEATGGNKFDDITSGQGFFLAADQGLKLRGGVAGMELYITSLGVFKG